MPSPLKPNAGTHKKKKHPRYDGWQYGLAFVAPLVIGVIVFNIIPIFYTFYMSLTDWSGLTPGKFIGLENFVRLLGDKQIHRELWNTLVYAFWTVPVSLALSILIANALNKKRKGTNLLTVIYFLPNVTMPAAIAIVWAWMFNSQYGIINDFLGKLHLPQPMWIADPNFIMPAIIIVSIWMGLGYNIIMLLAGLKDIPATYYEAAQLDGASGTKQFYKITLPLLSPTLFFLVVVSAMSAFKAFDIVYMFNASQSYGEIIDASRTMVFGIYERGFSFYQMGYASAEAVVLFAIIAVLTALQFAAQKKWVHYE